MSAFINLINQRFGRLIVIKRVGVNKQRSVVWECLCDCGNTTHVSSGHLQHGDTKSCGCYLLDKITKHGHNTDKKGKTATYLSWDAMIQRCTNPQHTSYPNYGGRGIKVCPRWLSFGNFLVDMGERSQNESIERKDNNKDYEPNNCIWINKKLQGQNTRKNKLDIDKVKFIRDSKLSGVKLAQLFNVRADHISKIRNNKSWVLN